MTDHPVNREQDYLRSALARMDAAREAFTTAHDEAKAAIAAIQALPAHRGHNSSKTVSDARKRMAAAVAAFRVEATAAKPPRQRAKAKHEQEIVTPPETTVAPAPSVTTAYDKASAATVWLTPLTPEGVSYTEVAKGVRYTDVPKKATDPE